MKKLMWVGTVAAAVLFLCLSSQVHAAGFDAKYYARRYPDVVAALGDDPDVLYNHYLQFGQKEHRFQNQAEESAVYSSQLQGTSPSPNQNQNNGNTNVNPNTNTYIDVDIASQTVTYFENGQVKLQTPCVTGNERLGRGTPRGTFTITAHQTDRYLIGPTWKSWVNRWMRFTKGGCGLHDASWRSKFGGEIYKTDGSHGCVNLPHDAALQLYDMVNVGTVVVVH